MYLYDKINVIIKILVPDYNRTINNITKFIIAVINEGFDNSNLLK